MIPPDEEAYLRNFINDLGVKDSSQQFGPDETVKATDMDLIDDVENIEPIA